MHTARLWAAVLAVATLGTVMPTHAEKAAAKPTAAAAKTASIDQTDWYDVKITLRVRPPRGARLVFGLVNGDVKFDNHVIVRKLATAGGRIGAAKATSGSAYEVEDGIRIDDAPSFASKWIQQDVTVGSSITFQVGVTRTYPWKAGDAYQPDQFSLAVLEASSNAGYLRSDDPTTANLVLSIDLAPGSTPVVYQPFPATAKGKQAAWSVSIKPVQVSP